MKAPQIVLLAIYAIEMGYQMANHGKQKPNYNFGDFLVSSVIILSVLYWGGFFS